MKKTLTILDLLTVFPTGMAFADRHLREADARQARANGRTTRRIKFVDGGCALNDCKAEKRQIGVSVQPATVHLIEIDDDDRLRLDRE